MKPCIIKVDGIDEMTHSELEQEVSSNVASESCHCLLAMELCFSQTGRVGVVMPKMPLNQNVIPQEKGVIELMC